jgi:uncharacterized protein
LEKQIVPIDFEMFIRSDGFPCAGAKAALARHTLDCIELGSFESASQDALLYKALDKFGAQITTEHPTMQSFASLFQPGPTLNETEFEALLWRHLQGLHDIDVVEKIDWATGVSSDPHSAHFCMSVAGVAYFVVGLHPEASRAARRFSRPAMIFNSHHQFELLRKDERFDHIQRITRDHEIQNAGGINPMLSIFGADPEASQYSGRRVDGDWICPLQVKT